ncbi:V-type ATP synthase subunit E [Dethiothermospora halolimnae]|uniref:V-type ATP synthase subunit E n=1 Tax=Dethiothermospora halolimnae TaxID=3114390 RepID=UPI003CCC07EB
MITIEKKLNTFSKLVFEKEQKKAQEKLEEIEKENQKIIESHKEEIQAKVKNIIDKKVKSAEIKKRQMISKANVNAKKNILEKKKELLDKIVDDVTEKARIYTDKEDYKDYLLENILDSLSGLDDKDIYVYLTEKDKNKYGYTIEKKLMDKGYNVKAKITDEDIIGGGVIINSNKSVRIDDTMKSKIEDNKKKIGNILYNALEKAGDAID